MSNNNDDEFSRFISQANFTLAWERISSSTRLSIKDREGANIYLAEDGLEVNRHFQIIIENIENGSFNPQEPYPVYQPKKNNGIRTDIFLTMDDRLVYHALGNIIVENAYDSLNELANKQIFAYTPIDPSKQSRFMFHPPFALPQRKDLGQYEKFKLVGKQLINEFVDNFPEPYLIGTDVQTFYPTVNHAQLINLLRDNQWLTDERLLNLLKDCLDRWQILSPYQCGIPIGYDTSDLLANLYLISLDKLFIEN
ncbi:MAG TPA: hypothetical protein PLZ51_02460, partial [Aggregatilineales bacterium]|nr:hypothetical protein [Aggregatilineales bacterium]